jgi:scyllo-inositol 2-dehydrogenase (NAD+)
MTKLGIGVVGVGEMGRRHAENLRRLVPQAHLVAVADVDSVRARQVAQELEIELAYDSTEALVERKDIEAVVIASPSGAHPESIRAAAAAGKHILCEKPLALSLEAADSALEAVTRAKVQFQIGHMRRYDPAYEAAMKRLEAGEIGEPVTFKSIGRDADAPPPSSFKNPLNGHLFLESSVHDFDLARWLMRDEVVELHAFAGVRAMPELENYGGFDSGIVNLRFSRGAIGNIESFICARYGYDVRTEIVGTKGTLFVGSVRATALEVLTDAGSGRDVVRHFLVRFADAYLAEMRDFVQAVITGRPTRVTAHDGRQSLALSLTSEKSYREGRSIRL